jgi:di/tricarboxylate transporter
VVRSSGKGKIFISSPKYPDRLWGPSNLLFNTYRLFFIVKRSDVKLTTQLHLILRLRMSGVRLALQHTLLLYAQGQPYLCLLVQIYLVPSANVHNVWCAIHLFILKCELKCLIWSLLLSYLLLSEQHDRIWIMVLRFSVETQTMNPWTKDQNYYHLD